MPILARVTALTAHIMFAQEGAAFTVPSAGTVGRTSKPGGADALWAAGNFGDCLDFKITPGSEIYEVKGGNPGGRTFKDILEIEKSLRFTWQNQQLDPITLQLLFGTQSLNPSSTVANPLEGRVMLKGWMKFQAYDPSQVMTAIGEVWVGLRVTDAEPWSGANPVQATFEATMLFSTLNTMSFH